MKKIKNVIIFSDSHDWHSNQLKKELKKLKCKVFCLSLDDCFINTNNKNNIFHSWIFKKSTRWLFYKNYRKRNFSTNNKKVNNTYMY